MENKKHTKKALLGSVIALILCCAMLIGTTFAWFTDTASSGSNVITSGNLDIEVEYTLDGTTWKDLDGANDLFMKDALWEPGHTEIAALKITNNGSLALKYAANMNIVEETPGINKAGQEFKLSDYLTVSTMAMGPFGEDVDWLEEMMISGALSGAFEDGLDSDSIDKTTKFGETNILFEGKDYGPEEGNLRCALKAGETAYVIVQVDMPETVGNEANHDGVHVPSIEFGINVTATQTPEEYDSFGNQYDANAGYKTNVGPYKLNVLSGGSATYDATTKTYNIIVYSISEGGYNAVQGGKYYAGYSVNVGDYAANATVSFDKEDGSTTVWKLADEEADGFINNGVHQQWTSAGTYRAYRYDINGDGVTDFTVVNDVSNAETPDNVD